MNNPLVIDFDKRIYSRHAIREAVGIMSENNLFLDMKETDTSYQVDISSSQDQERMYWEFCNLVILMENRH